MTRSSARWSGTHLGFVATSGSGHEVVVDEPPPLGEDQGMRPTELLLSALASCAGINAVSLLGKMRQPLRGLTVEVDGDQETDWPHAFTAIRLTFVTDWEGEPDPGLVAKALDYAVHRYCPVHATLERGTALSYTRRDA